MYSDQGDGANDFEGPFSGTPLGCPSWVKSGNAPNEPMMSAFHLIANEQRTQFYVGFVPTGDIRVVYSIT
jgi:hypothetical protein